MIGSLSPQLPLTGLLRPLEAGENRTDRPAAAGERTTAPVASAQTEQALQQADDVVRSVEARLNELASDLIGANSRLSIEADKETGRYIYRSVDRESGEVLAEWPPEQLLRLAAFLDKGEGEGRVLDATA